jgi:succinate dehydrogenase flavin-adding protein (antitoxin of CptAB toxin-antitoxin module)
VEKGALVQVENNNKNENIKSLIQQDFREKILSSMKENLIFSLLSFLFAKIMSEDSDLDKKNFQKEFITYWKNGISEVTQNNLASINKLLNENNIDMINMIVGNNTFADIEDYQEIINQNLKEVEAIFWKICGEDKDLK